MPSIGFENESNADAFQWYIEAAQQGNVAAQSDLANLYCYGAGVAQDYGESLKWWKRPRSRMTHAHSTAWETCTYSHTW